MLGNTPPLAIVTEPSSLLNSSSFFTANWMCLGMILFFLLSLAAFPANSKTYQIHKQNYEKKLINCKSRFIISYERKKNTNEPQQQGIQGRRRDRRESRIRRAGRIGLSWGSERHGQPGTGDRPCGIWTPVSCPWTCPAHPWLLQHLNSCLRNGFFFWGRLRVLNKFVAVCDENVAGLFLVHIEMRDAFWLVVWDVRGSMTWL